MVQVFLLQLSLVDFEHEVLKCCADIDVLKSADFDIEGVILFGERLGLFDLNRFLVQVALVPRYDDLHVFRGELFYLLYPAGKARKTVSIVKAEHY